MPRIHFHPRTIAVAAALAAAGAAFAQPAAEQRIEITGSSIKRIADEGALPIQVLTRADIEASGATSAAALLDIVAANNNAGGQYRVNNTNNTVLGGSGVSLRGLGPNSTLVLLNGRRVAFYGFSDQSVFVDLGSIPMSAIERVEILKDGASAIYGSDALAGVVNFILRRHYEGAEARLTVGGSLSYRDHEQQTLTLTAGTTRGKLSLLGIVEGYHSSPVQVSERRGGKQAERTAAAIAAGYTNALLFEGAGVGGNFPSTSTSGGNWYSNNPADGGKVEYYAAGRCDAPNVLYSGTYNGFAAKGMCLDTETDRFNTLNPKTDKTSLFGRASYEISPTLSAFGELSHARIEQGYDYWPVFKNDYYDTSTTPHFPLDRAPAGWGYYARLYDELGIKRRDVSSTSTRLVAGLEGRWGRWDWNAAVTHSRNRTDFLGTNYISSAVWYDGVASGAINPFQPLTAANVAALRTTHTRQGASTFTLVDATLSGPIGRLGGGDAMLALGLNLRAEKMSDGIDAPSNAGLVENTAVRLPISASRDAQAVYAELALPFARTLEAQLALRADRFDGAGSSTNPKLALKWTPFTQLALRGSYTTGFRAPSLAETHGGTRFYVNCPTSVPICPPYSQVWGNQVTVTFGDSSDLEPEKSTSKTIGLVWEPLSGHSIAVDLWSIKRRNQVYAPSVTNPADAAFFTLLSGASNAAAAAFSARYVNLGQTLTEGVDIALRNQWKLAAGTLRLALNSTMLETFDTEFRGVTTSLAGSYGYPKWRHRADLSFARQAWTLALAANHRDAFRQAVAGPAGTDLKVGAFTTFDLYAAYRAPGSKLGVSGGIGNLLAKQPPFDRLGRLGTLYEDSSDRRTAWLTLDYRF